MVPATQTVKTGTNIMSEVQERYLILRTKTNPASLLQIPISHTCSTNESITKAHGFNSSQAMQQGAFTSFVAPYQHNNLATSGKNEYFENRSIPSDNQLIVSSTWLSNF